MPSARNQANAFAKQYDLPLFALDSIKCEKRDNGTWKKNIRFHGKKEEGYMWGFPLDAFTNGKALYKTRKDDCFAVKTGKQSGVMVLDFDDAEYYHQTMEHLGNEMDEDGDMNPLYCPEIANTLTIKSRKGFHVYLRVPEDMGMFANSTNVWDAPLDIRGEGGCSICPPSMYEMEDDDIEYTIQKDHAIAIMSNTLYSFLSQAKNARIYGKTYNDEISGNGINMSSEKLATTDLGRLTECINLLPDEFCSDYERWFRIGSIIATETNRSDSGLKLFMEVSRKAKDYEMTPDHVYEKKWQEFQIGKCTMGSLIHYMRELGIKIPFIKPTEWMGVDTDDDSDDEGFSSIELMKRQRTKPITDELLAIMSKKPKDQSPEEKKQISDFFNQRYKIMKKYFEKYHFFNNDTESVVYLNPEGDWKLVKNHKLVYCDCTLDYKEKGNDFIDSWLRDMYKRKYDKIDFLPPPANVPSRIYNSFNGFKIEKTESTEGDCPEILEHIKSLVNYDDESARYILSYMAHLVQKPGELPLTSLIFMGDQGTGKNLFWEKFARTIMGERYLVSTCKQDHIVGTYPIIGEKLLVIMDEANSKDSFMNAEKIKELITQPMLSINKKYFDIMNVRNFGRYVFFTNNKTPVKIEQSDRRFVVFKTSNTHIGDAEYFTRLANVMDDPVYMKRFYDALMSLDISDFIPGRDRPITEIYKDIQSATVPVPVRFMREYKDANEPQFDGSTGATNPLHEIKASDLYRKFKNWCEGMNEGLNERGRCMSSTAFGRAMNDIGGIERKRTKYGMMYEIDWEKLNDGICE